MEPEIVNYFEADLPSRRATIHAMKADLDDGRTIEVGHTDEGARWMRFERPLEDGRRSRLEFALTREAARHVLRMLALDFAKLGDLFDGEDPGNEEEE